MGSDGRSTTCTRKWHGTDAGAILPQLWRNFGVTLISISDPSSLFLSLLPRTAIEPREFESRKLSMSVLRTEDATGDMSS